jgi:hypothetical protein
VNPIEFDTTTALGRHAEAERVLSKHRGGQIVPGCGDGSVCAYVIARDLAYRDYTKRTHVSLRNRWSL